MANQAEIPMLPVLSASNLRLQTAHSDRTNRRSDTNSFRLYSSGRVALAGAFKALNVRRNDEILLPAYHCESMLDPADWFQATPRLYNIHQDARPDLDDIASKIDVNTRAVVAAHFYGRLHDFSVLAEFCKDRNIALIEDFAHVLVHPDGRWPNRIVGDFAIASLRKFFPIQDGGLLYMKRHDLEQPRSNGLRYELKVILNTLEYSSRFGRLRPVSTLARQLGRISLKPANKDRVSSSIPDATTTDQQPRNPTNTSDGSMSAFSKHIVRTSDANDIATRRRTNYAVLSENLTSLRRGRLQPIDTENSFVPYVLVIEIDDPPKTHARLLDAGVPVWRWDTIRQSGCKHSRALSQRHVQIPCHQSLTEDEIGLLTSRIRAALA